MRTVGLLLLGYTLWAALFTAIYALQATGCALAMPPTILRGLLIGLHVAGILAGLVVVMLAMRHRGQWRLTLVCVSIGAAGATLLTSSGVVWMRLC